MLDMIHTSNKQSSWKSITKKYDVYIFQKSFPDSSVKCQMGTGIINLPAAKIVEALMDLHRQKEWDPLYKDGTFPP